MNVNCLSFSFTFAVHANFDVLIELSSLIKMNNKCNEMQTLCLRVEITIFNYFDIFFFCAIKHYVKRTLWSFIGVRLFRTKQFDNKVRNRQSCISNRGRYLYCTYTQIFVQTRAIEEVV